MSLQSFRQYRKGPEFETEVHSTLCLTVFDPYECELSTTSVYLSIDVVFCKNVLSI